MRRSLFPAMVSLLLLLVLAIPGQALARPEFVPLSSLRPNQIGVTFMSPSGQPLSNATVRVFLIPWNAPSKFRPMQITGGSTNQSGAFIGTIATDNLQTMMKSTGGLTPIFNAMVLIASGTSWGVHFFVLRSGSAQSLRAIVHLVPGHSGMTPAQLTNVSYVVSSSSCGGCQPDKVEWPRVFVANSSGGTETNYTYTDLTSSTHELSTTVALSTTYSDSGFSADGMAAEVDARSAAEGPIQHDGAFHYFINAKYTYREYFAAQCGQGGICQHEYWWDPLQWDGALEVGGSSTTPSVNHSDTFVGPYLRGYTQGTIQSWMFGANFSIFGVGIKSVAQYAYSTYERWSKYGSCGRTNLVIYGNNNYWNVSGAVYTNCYG